MKFCLRRSFKLFSSVFLINLMVGCAAYSVMNSERYSSTAEIPAEYYPPQGQCRIWYKDQPARQQPKPDACANLEHRVPVNAVLLRGD